MPVFPNPVTEMFNIQGSMFKVHKIELWNSVGEKVLEKNVLTKKEMSVNVKNPDKGVYVFKIFSENIIVTGKFILE